MKNYLIFRIFSIKNLNKIILPKISAIKSFLSNFPSTIQLICLSYFFIFIIDYTTIYFKTSTCKSLPSSSIR